MRSIGGVLEGNKSNVVVDNKTISRSNSDFSLAGSSNDNLVGGQGNDVGLKLVGFGVSGSELHGSSSVSVVQLKDLGARSSALEAKRVLRNEPRASRIVIDASNFSNASVVQRAIPSIVAERVNSFVLASSSSASVFSAANSVVAPSVSVVVRASRGFSSGRVANVLSAVDSIVASSVVGDDNASVNGRADMSGAVGEVVASLVDGQENASKLVSVALIESAVKSVIAKSVHLGVDASSVRAFIESARNVVVAHLVVEVFNASLGFNRALRNVASIGRRSAVGIGFDVGALSKIQVASIYSASDSVVASSSGVLNRALSVRIAVVNSAGNVVVANDRLVVAFSVASANVDGAKIIVVAFGVVGGVDATNDGRANVVSAGESIAASFVVGGVNALSGKRIARVISARNSVIAVDGSSNTSVRSFFGDTNVADPSRAKAVSSGGAIVVIGDVGASSKVGVALVVGAGPVVNAQAGFGFVRASGNRMALIDGTVDIVRAIDLGEVAETVSSAEVHGANRVIVAVGRVRNVEALAEGLVAVVISASSFSVNQFVIAQIVVGFVFANTFTIVIDASIFGASKIVIALLDGLDASVGIGLGLVGSANENVASSNSSLFVASVVDGDVLALSEFLVAEIVSTFDMIVAEIVFGFVDALSSFARINSALNAIVAVHLVVEALVVGFLTFFSLSQGLASIDSASVVIVAPFVHGNSNASRNGVHAGLFGIADKFVSAVDVIFAQVEVDGVKALVSSNGGFLASIDSASNFVVASSFEEATFVVSFVSVFVGIEKASILSASSSVRAKVVSRSMSASSRSSAYIESARMIIFASTFVFDSFASVSIDIGS